MLEHEAKRIPVSLPSLLKTEYIEPLLRKYAFYEIEDIFAAVGFGALASGNVIARLLEEQRRLEKPASAPSSEAGIQTETAPAHQTPSHGEQGIFVRGEPGMLVRFAKCCSPLPGDEITGFITRGRGVTVHKTDCVNVTFEKDTERLVEVSWNSAAKSAFSGAIQIVAYDRMGLLADLMAALGNLKVVISAISAKTNKHEPCSISATLEVENRTELDRIIRQLSKRSDIINIHRVSA
jgi:GTP pyrophosphokinase